MPTSKCSLVPFSTFIEICLSKFQLSTTSRPIDSATQQIHDWPGFLLVSTVDTLIAEYCDLEAAERDFEDSIRTGRVLCTVAWAVSEGSNRLLRFFKWLRQEILCLELFDFCCCCFLRCGHGTFLHIQRHLEVFAYVGQCILSVSSTRVARSYVYICYICSVQTLERNQSSMQRNVPPS